MTNLEIRLQAQNQCTARYLASRAQRQRPKPPDPTGLKLWYVPGSEFAEGSGILTRYAGREKRRRRAARRAAHESRRVSR